MIAATVVFWLETKWSISQKAKSKQEEDSAIAFSALMKLVQNHALLRSLKQHCDECSPLFDEQRPADYFFPLLFNPPADFHLSPAELALCIRSGDEGLLDKLLSLQSNAHTQISAFNKMNSMLEDYRLFKAQNALPTSSINGDVGTLEFPPEKVHELETRATHIDALVGKILEHIENDANDYLTLVTRFNSALNSIDGLEVPQTRLIQ